MITLIAESKTMTLAQKEVVPDEYEKHCPAFIDKAAEIATKIREMAPQEISERLSISMNLAIKAYQLIYEFFNKSKGNHALDAFTGEVFRALDAESLSQKSREFASSHVMIVSSLYGLLKPEDIIKPYRLDYNADMAPGNVMISKFWKPILTVGLIKNLKDKGEKEVLNLLPSEASKCFDWKLIKNFVKVETPVFKSITEDGKLKTPHSGKIKELRGKLLREILTNKTDNLKDAVTVSGNTFHAVPEEYKKGMPMYLSLE